MSKENFILKEGKVSTFLTPSLYKSSHSKGKGRELRRSRSSVRQGCFQDV